MTGPEMWAAFCLKNNIDIDTRHDMWKFCGGGVFADDLANLVLAGIKTATASSKIAYDTDGDPLPVPGTYSVILFNNEEAACILQDTKVSVVPFNEVSEEHAYREGENDRSLENWREVHKRAFSPDYKRAGQEFDEKSLCVLEEFQVVYK